MGITAMVFASGHAFAQSRKLARKLSFRCGAHVVTVRHCRHHALAPIQRCVAGYSVEVTPQAARRVKSFADADGLQRGTTVNVTFLPNSAAEETVALCRRLLQEGMHPVAHLPTRRFVSLAAVEIYLTTLREAGVKEVLVIGGDVPAPAGALVESLQVLESGLLEKYGVTRVGVAAHPEGHPDIDDATLDEVLLRKAQWANTHGVDLYFETQFCFEAEPVVQWERRVRSLMRDHLRNELPAIVLGVAGPTKLSSLLRFALAAGVGPSVRFLTRHTGDAVKLASRFDPSNFVAGIAAHQVNDPDCLVTRLHLYSFGGLLPTLRWANGVVEGNLDMHSGFSDSER